jgi:hypothetical protein
MRYLTGRKTSDDPLGLQDVMRVGMERKRVVAMRREKSDGAVVVWMPRPMNPGDRWEGKTGRSEGHLAVSSWKPRPSGTA